MTPSQWYASSSKPIELINKPVPFYVIHHTVSPHCTTKSECSKQMRNIQNWHMDGNGWSNIGYSFLIGEDGRIYEGRGWETVGAHSYGYNRRSVGIAFIGTFTNGLPKSLALIAAKELISCGVRLGYVTNDYSIVGHRQTSATLCPGNDLFNEISTWTQFNLNPL